MYTSSEQNHNLPFASPDFSQGFSSQFPMPFPPQFFPQQQELIAQLQKENASLKKDKETLFETLCEGQVCFLLHQLEQKIGRNKLIEGGKKLYLKNELFPSEVLFSYRCIIKLAHFIGFCKTLCSPSACARNRFYHRIKWWDATIQKTCSSFALSALS